MTDEEKKAIESFKNYLDYVEINNFRKMDRDKYLEILLNLIEKQSKIIQAMAGDIFIEIIKPDGQHFATEEEVIKFYEKVVGE